MATILASNQDMVFETNQYATVKHLDPVPEGKIAMFELSGRSTPINITEDSWVGDVNKDTKLTNTSSPGIRIEVISKLV